MRRFNTAYVIAKLSEVLGWVVMAGGSIAAVLVSISLDLGIGVVLGGIAGSILTGLALIFNSQLVQVLLSTENSTYLTLEELSRTNSMLQDTLGKMTVSLQKMAEKEKKA